MGNQRQVFFRGPSGRVGLYNSRRLRNNGKGTFVNQLAQTTKGQDDLIQILPHSAPILLQAGYRVQITVDGTFSNFSSGASGACTVGVYDKRAGVFIDAARLEGYGDATPDVEQIQFTIVPTREMSLILMCDTATGTFDVDADLTMTIGDPP